MMLHRDNWATGQVAAYCATVWPQPFTEIEFCAWLGQATPGDRLVYHRGFLGIDATATTVPEEERLQLETLATAAYRAFEAGFVDLVQRRLGVNDFAYIAIARTRPQNTPIPLDSLLSDKEAA